MTVEKKALFDYLVSYQISSLGRNKRIIKLEETVLPAKF